MPWRGFERKPTNGESMVKLCSKWRGRSQDLEVHRKLIYISDLLLPLLASWNGSGAQSINLPFRLRLPVMDIYELWLHERKIYTNAETVLKNGHVDSRGRNEIILASGLELMAVWFLGNDLKDVRLKVMVVSDIIERLREAKESERDAFFGCLTPIFIKDVYSNTVADAPMRRLIVDAIVKYRKSTVVAFLGSDYPVEFGRAIIAGAFHELERLRSKGKTVTFGADPTNRSAAPNASPANILKSATIANNIVKNTGSDNVGLLSDECVYHEHVRFGWLCSRLKP